jgi:hypothetical protein
VIERACDRESIAKRSPGSCRSGQVEDFAQRKARGDTMADFPENDVEILDDYISDDFVNGMRTGLSAATISFEGEVIQPADGLVELIVADRNNLIAFMSSPVFTQSLAGLAHGDSLFRRTVRSQTPIFLPCARSPKPIGCVETLC